MDILKTKESRVWLITLASSLFLLTSFYIYLFLQNKNQIILLEASKQKFNQDIKNLEYKVEKYACYTEHKKMHTKNFAKLEYYNSQENREFHTKIIQNIADKIPVNIFLADLAISKNIVLGGYSDNIKSILDFLDDLSKLPYICNGKIVKLKMETLQKNMLEFQIRLDIKPCKEI